MGEKLKVLHKNILELIQEKLEKAGRGVSERLLHY